jgi:hypothetical protein
LDAFEFLKRNVFIDLFDVGTGVTW